VEGAQDCLRFLGCELRDGQPKGDNAAVLKAVVHQSEKLLRVKIDRPSHLQGWRLTGDNVVAIRADLKKEAAVLDKCRDAWIAQRI